MTEQDVTEVRLWRGGTGQGHVALTVQSWKRVVYMVTGMRDGACARCGGVNNLFKVMS